MAALCFLAVSVGAGGAPCLARWASHYGYDLAVPHLADPEGDGFPSCEVSSHGVVGDVYR